MEEEVLERHGSRKTTGACSQDEVSPQLCLVYPKERQGESKAKGREGRECLVPLLLQIDRVCRQCVKEGDDPANDGNRCEHLLDIFRTYYFYFF